MSNMTEENDKGKRKHMEGDMEDEDVPSSSTTYKGPILVTFPGAKPPPGTEFELHVFPHNQEHILTSKPDKTLWIGETLGSEYRKYAVAVFDEQNETFSLQPASQIFSVHKYIEVAEIEVEPEERNRVVAWLLHGNESFEDSPKMPTKEG